MPAIRPSQTMNQSAHTLADLTTLATAEPAAAQTYLAQVETNLRGLGQTAAADTLAQVLASTGSLVERISANSTQLTAIFPSSAEDWAKVQSQRAQTIGYGAAEPTLPKAQFVTGELKNVNGVAMFTTAGGRELKLANSPLQSKVLQMEGTKMQGMLGDGPITLQGSIGEDNQTFNVEGFALNTDGKFDNFVFGRVKLDGDKVFIHTARAEVEVTDPELHKRLAAMNEFAVVLPGGPEEKDGKLVYTQMPAELFGMGRFKQLNAQAAGETVTTIADMANSHFASKPVVLPAAMADRINHSGRLFLRGMVELGADGIANKFNASYCSRNVDGYGLQFGVAAQDADAVQAAVMHDIV